MSKDRYERRHRRTTHPAAAGILAAADFDAAPPLAEVLADPPRCLHASDFPCLQCEANRRWNELATGTKLTDEEFRERYTLPAEQPREGGGA